MVKCSAIGCKNQGIHNFPKDSKLRKLWEEAIDHNFKSEKHSRLCYDHFKPEDYQSEGFFSGLPNTRKMLKRGIVPSIFPTTVLLKKEIPNSDNETQNIEQMKHCQNNSFLRNKYKTEPCQIIIFEEQLHPSAFQSIACQTTNCLYTVEHFWNNDEGIEYYTGLLTFKMFKDVFDSLCPEASVLRYSRYLKLDMSPEDQLFLTLMKLRKNKDDYELSLFFDINISSVKDMFIKWIELIHDKWQDSSISKSLDNMPFLNKATNDNTTYTVDFQKGGNDDIELSAILKNKQFQEIAKIYTFLKGPIDKTFRSIFSKILFVCRILFIYKQDILIIDP